MKVRILSLLGIYLLFCSIALAELPASVESLGGEAKIEIAKITRKNNVITIRGTISNLDDKNYHKTFESKDMYLLNEEKGIKYFGLRDEEKQLLVSHYSYPGLGVSLKPRESTKFWVKFTAPPAEVKKVSMIFETFEILEDLPISDES